MTKLLLLLAVLTTPVLASEGQELHDESCLACHIAEHTNAFYNRTDRKMTSLSQLSGQVSRCAQNFSVDWFPEEEAAVLDYLNAKYYRFKP